MFWLIALCVVVPFAYVLLFGAPYLPTRKTQVNQALDLLDLKEGELLVDLGSGDGAVLVEAAKRGIKCIGYELNPLVFCVAYLRVWRYRKLVTVRLRNFWKVPLPKETKGVFVFLLDKYMVKLDRKFETELSKGTKVVSYTFEIPDKKSVEMAGPLNLYTY
ncbi:hypothetical protein KBD20_03340 [Candidatus Saccharibacteria bacterium]|nr:hypothetical protein [Candidatus Saccharibacteria bacterium]